jgi:hypothetical protein
MRRYLLSASFVTHRPRRRKSSHLTIAHKDSISRLRSPQIHNAHRHNAESSAEKKSVCTYHLLRHSSVKAAKFASEVSPTIWACHSLMSIELERLQLEHPECLTTGCGLCLTRLIRSPQQYAFYQLEMAMVIDSHRIGVVDVTTPDYVFGFPSGLRRASN